MISRAGVRIHFHGCSGFSKQPALLFETQSLNVFYFQLTSEIFGKRVGKKEGELLDVKPFFKKKQF